MELANPHDRFFKKLFSRDETVRDFVAHYLPPEIADRIDASSLALEKDTFVDKELREHFSDLLWRARLKDGRMAYLYVLFEHKSYPDAMVAFQLLRYMFRVWESRVRPREKLAPIVPIVVYHGREGWNIGVDLHAVFEMPFELKRMVPDYEYVLCDLSSHSDADIKGELLSRAGLLLMKHIFQDDLPERFRDVLRLLSELAERQEAIEWLEVFLRYVTRGTDKIGRDDLRRAVEGQFSREGGGIVGTLADQWIEEGMRKGLQQGLLRAIEMGLQLKFGADGLRLLPEIRKISDADVLEAIEQGIKTVATIEELKRIYAP
ncbi:MAG: Rpn family recombination-promoting nuclease/putative transposase [Acidobacteriota bacterium]